MWHDLETDRLLDELEKRIIEVYKVARKEVGEKADLYFAKFKVRYEKEYRAYLDGKYTEEEFRKWVYNQICRGRRWEQLKNDMEHSILTANERAFAYVNDVTPQIYSLNHNFEAHVISSTHDSQMFAVYNEQAIKQLMVRKTKLLPDLPKHKKVNIPKHKRWNKTKMQKEALQYLIQGSGSLNHAKGLDKSYKSGVGGLADRFQEITDMDRDTALRNARTTITNVQNAGRMGAIMQAQRMGMDIEKKWIATKDLRTRHSHAMLDGKCMPIYMAFSNGLMYPADPNGKPSEVYNCRCTLRSVDPNVPRKRINRVQNPAWIYANEEERKNIPKTVIIGEMSYRDWYKWQKGYKP